MKDYSEPRAVDLAIGIRIGYARVSSDDQILAMQIDALKAAGCAQIYQETASGKQTDRLELAHALKALRKGDTLTVWRLDRLGRSVPHLIETIGSIERLGASFESLTEKIETSSAAGRLVFHLFASLAEFERNLISERTKEGLKAARKRGVRGGRKLALDAKAVKQVLALMADRSTRPADIASQYKISKSTLYKIVRTNGAQYAL